MTEKYSYSLLVGERRIPLRAIDDYHAHEQAQAIVNRAKMVGKLSVDGGRIIMRDKPGFADFITIQPVTA